MTLDGPCDWCEREAVAAREMTGFNAGPYAGATYMRACEKHKHLLWKVNDKSEATVINLQEAKP